MKKLVVFTFLSTFLMISAIAQSSPKFVLTKDGVNPVVLNFDMGVTAEQIYKKTKEWYEKSFQNPQTIIRVDNKNTLIKIAASKEKAWKIRDNNFDHFYDLEYTLTIEMKDSKCRVTFATTETKYKVWFNKDGSTIPKFKDSKAGFEASINDPLTSLYKYIKEPKKVVKDDW